MLERPAGFIENAAINPIKNPICKLDCLLISVVIYFKGNFKGRQGSYTSKVPRSTCCFAVPSGDFSGYFAFSMSSSSPRRYSRFFSIFLPRLSSFIVNSLRRPDYCSKLQYTIQCCSTQYNAAVQTEYNGIRRTEQRLG